MEQKHIQFILARAAALLVEAYGKVIHQQYQPLWPLDLSIGPDAPETFEALRDMALDRGQLKVSTLHNSTSVYGAAGNLTFRVFHDYGHLIYNAKFDTEAEIRLAWRQWDDVCKFIPHEWYEVCKHVYLADTVETSQYEATHGMFPADQTAFILPQLAAYFE